MMNTSTFVFGSEIQGSGRITAFDVLTSFVMFSFALVGVVLDVANLIFIKRLKIFHNAFGWFWSSRVISDGIIALVNTVYIAPVILLQPSNIPVSVSVIPYAIFFVCAIHGCLMHAAIAANRSVAVYRPLDYIHVFRNKTSFVIIALAWLSCLLCAPVFIAVPCNLVGFSPRLYEYVFISCAPEVDRDYSIVITVANHFCCVLCLTTVIVDCGTLGRIIYIRRVMKIGAETKNFKRDVRFFKQSAFQNITMILGVVMIIQSNNRNDPERATTNILTMTAVMLTHVTNPLSLLIFNPEVRRRLHRTTSVWATESHPPKPGVDHLLFKTKRIVYSK